MIFIDGYIEYLSPKGCFAMQIMVASMYSRHARFCRAYAPIGVVGMVGDSMRHIFMASMPLSVHVLVMMDVKEV